MGWDWVGVNFNFKYKIWLWLYYIILELEGILHEEIKGNRIKTICLWNKISTLTPISTHNNHNRGGGGRNSCLNFFSGYAYPCNLKLFTLTFWIASGWYLEHEIKSRDTEFHGNSAGTIVVHEASLLVHVWTLIIRDCLEHFLIDLLVM